MSGGGGQAERPWQHQEERPPGTGFGPAAGSRGPPAARGERCGHDCHVDHGDHGGSGGSGESDYTDESGSEGGGGGQGDDPEAEERAHFLDVCWSFVAYPDEVRRDLNRFQEGLKVLGPEDTQLWLGEFQPVNWLAELRKRCEINSHFLRMLPSPEVCGLDLGPAADRVVAEVPEGHRVSSRDSSKVQSTLWQFVRDWAVEGEAERAASYGPVMEALLRYKPPLRGAPPPTVLCPGCGLGRLPFELVRLGYAAQGNEFSYHMLLGSHFVLNRCVEAECQVIFPFVMSTANRLQRANHLRAVRIPDVCPRTALGDDSQLSMTAGEFIEVYKEQVAEWDAVATCFFLDTAKNVLLYIRIIATIIRPGGLWINLGPLLYHYADSAHGISIELSWEEVRPAICRYFDILEESTREAQYTTNPDALMRVKYRCIFFVAVRNGQPTTGTSHPVF